MEKKKFYIKWKSEQGERDCIVKAVNLEEALTIFKSEGKDDEVIIIKEHTNEMVKNLMYNPVEKKRILKVQADWNKLNKEVKKAAANIKVVNGKCICK